MLLDGAVLAQPMTAQGTLGHELRLDSPREKLLPLDLDPGDAVDLTAEVGKIEGPPIETVSGLFGIGVCEALILSSAAILELTCRPSIGPFSWFDAGCKG